jgi:hypothetical protein
METRKQAKWSSTFCNFFKAIDTLSNYATMHHKALCLVPYVQHPHLAACSSLHACPAAFVGCLPGVR